MLLTDLRNYIRLRPHVSMTELSGHFKDRAQDLQPLLDHWLAKGCIECVSSSSCGGACGSCPLRCAQYYRYVSG